MGVVHLARRGDGPRVALKVLRPHIVGRRRGATPAGARGRVAEPDQEPVGRRDRRRRPVGAGAVRRHPLRPGSLAARLRARGGADHGQGPDLVRRLPGRGRRVGARGRRAAPRREAVQRADGGPDADPHRLRPGPGRRRPEADPHRLAARHAGLPRARDPARRRRHHRLRRALVGGDRRLRRRPASRPSAAGRRWRSWTGSAAASTTSPASRSRCASSSPTALDPDAARRPDARRDPGLAAAAGRARRRGRRPPPAPDKLTMPYAVAARTSPDARSTDVLPGGPPVGADGTKMLTEHQTVLERDPRTLPPPPPLPAEQGRPPFAERARRATLLVVGALLCGGIVAAYPWYGSVALAAARLAAAQRLAGRHRGRRRRRLRGRKWYDGAQLLVRRPVGAGPGAARDRACSSCGAPAWRSPRRCSATRSSPARR